MSLSRCLKKLGVSQHEAAIYKAVFDDYRNDGIDASTAARKAVQERHDELMAERESVAKQVVAAGGQMPALPGVTAPTEGGQRMALAKDYQKAGDARKAIAYHGLQTTHAPAKVANDWKIVPKEQAQKIAASNRQSAQQAKESRTPGMANNAYLKREFHRRGITKAETADIIGEKKERGSSAMVGTFRPAGLGIDDHGSWLVEDGWLPPESQSQRGNENVRASADDVRDLMRRVFDGEQVHRIADQADAFDKQSNVSHSEWTEQEAARLNVPAEDLAAAVDPTLTREQNESAFDVGQFLQNEGFDNATSEEIRQLAVARADSQADFDRDYNTDLEAAVRSIAASRGREARASAAPEALELTGQTNAETLADEKPKTADEIYDASRAAWREASRTFTAAQTDYRAKKIGDTEFLAARAEFDRAEKISDEAESAFIKAKDIEAAAEKEAAKKVTADQVDLFNSQGDLLSAPQPNQTDAVAAVANKIEDFGEKLEGAKKDRAPSLSKALSDDEIAREPLSKIWPADEVAKIEDPFTAAVAYTTRDAIPAKPRKGYKLERWVEKVKMLRGLAAHITGGTVTPQRFMELMRQQYSLQDLASKITLLEAVDRSTWSRIGAVSEHPTAYTYNAEGKQEPAPSVMVQVDGRSHQLAGSGKALDHLDAINAMLGTAKPEKQMQFEVRGRESDGYRINKKGDPEWRPLKEFADTKAAFAYIKDNHADLVAAWEGVKDRDNVRESDVRGAENRPRSGANWRQGENVTDKQFDATFGFRGVQFGEWVDQGNRQSNRQGALNAAYDALMDLASIVNVPPKALSLNGSMGLSFGARGSGSAAAHFEPGNLVINLTKTRGAGTLAHEWFHALDNYFSRQRGGEIAMKPGMSQQDYRMANYITYRPEPLMVRKDGRSTPLSRDQLEQYRKTNPSSKYLAADQWQVDPKHPAGVRPEVEQAFATLVEALNDSPMAKRAKLIDKSPNGYWSRIIERGARSFENYVISKMMENGYHNDYLANVMPARDFERSKERYPYLLAEEVKPIADAFDNLFATVEAKETDKGVALAAAEALGTSSTGQPISRERVAQIVNAVRAKSKFPIVMYDGKPSDLHSSLSDDAPGAYWQGKVHIFPANIASTNDLYRVLAHELVGHASVIEMMGAEYQTVVKQIQTAKKFNPAVRELAKIVAQTHGEGLTAAVESSEIIAAATERLLDENGNVRPEFGWFKRVLSSVAQWLRSQGITVPFTNAELAGMISRAANRLSTKPEMARGEPALAAGKEGLSAGSNDPSILAAAKSREPSIAGFGPHAIRDSSGAFTNLKTAAINHVSDVFTNNKMFSTAKLGMLPSLATQRQKAFVDPENFGKVHQAVQSYLSSVSTFALRAANLAPDVLKQITSVHDAIKSLGSLAQFKQTKADNAALSKTLNRERDIKHRMTDAEMTAAGLTDHQQAMVHQSHDAMDKSMRDLNAASLARMLNGKGMDAAVNAMIESGDVGPVLDSLKTRIEATNDTALQSIYDVAKERTDRIEQLIRQGYVPHIRYGEWAVDVIAPHGERWSFSMFESQRAANAAARAMNERTPGYKITVSKMAKEAPRLFDGVSPDVLELFVDQMAEKGIVDPKESEAYQAFLKNVVANNSAMKRLLHSNDVAGYSEDITRVLASFTTANARMAAILTHGPSITQAIGAIDPKTHAESFDEAVKLRDYILNPTEEFAKLRSFLFMNYLGGSVASALTNITQPILTTLPRLSEYAGLKTMGYLKDGAAVAISRIFKGGTIPSGPLRNAIDRGEQDGVLMPQEMHQLYAEAIKGLGSGVGARAVMQLMGSFFSVSEQFNRELTFVAAFKTAEKMTPEQIHAAGAAAGMPGIVDAYTFAKMIVEDTQFLYNRGNKPNAARGMLAPIFTFKQFSIQYLELIKRLPPQQRMLALGLLALASGVNGLPFSDNLDDLIDTIAQSLGFDTNVKQTKRALAYKAFGKTFGDFVLNGASALPGVPLDVQQRLGMASIVPGTGIFKPSTSDKWKEVLEWFGAPGSVAHSYGQAIGNVQDGRLDLATLSTMPTFMRNILVAEKMWETGEYRSAAGKKVMDVDKVDAIVKALGFQPQDVAQTMRVNKEVQQNEDLVKNTRNAIMGKIVQSIVENDPKGRMAAFAELMDWNKSNPTSMIVIKPDAIQSAVRNARMTTQQRSIKQASPTIRGGVSSQWMQ